MVGREGEGGGRKETRERERVLGIPSTCTRTFPLCTDVEVTTSKQKVSTTMYSHTIICAQGHIILYIIT